MFCDNFAAATFKIANTGCFELTEHNFAHTVHFSTYFQQRDY